MGGADLLKERQAGVTIAVLCCVVVAAFAGAAKWDSGRPKRRMLGVSCGLGMTVVG